MNNFGLNSDIVTHIFQFVPQPSRSKIMCLNKRYKDDFLKNYFNETREKIGLFGENLILRGLSVIEEKNSLVEKYNIALKKIEEEELILSEKSEKKQKTLNKIKLSILSVSRAMPFGYLFHKVIDNTNIITKTIAKILLWLFGGLRGEF